MILRGATTCKKRPGDDALTSRGLGAASKSDPEAMGQAARSLPLRYRELTWNFENVRPRLFAVL